MWVFVIGVDGFFGCGFVVWFVMWLLQDVMFVLMDCSIVKFFVVGVEVVVGDFVDFVFWVGLFDFGFDFVFYFVSVFGSLVECQQEVGLQVNFYVFILLVIEVVVYCFGVCFVFVLLIVVYGVLSGEMVMQVILIFLLIIYGVYKFMMELLFVDMI